tara:strand:+ start:485 stop:1096 length:612 start_codon:yes stop_codon:yes gene_type:complete
LAGDDHISITVDGPREAQAVARHLRADGAWLEVVAGINSVVVQFDLARMAPQDAIEQIQKASAEAFVDDTPIEIFEIPVEYGGDCGPELEAICELLKMSAAEFIEIHTAGEYEVDMIGFTPGFAYVGGLDARLDIPRLDEPRVSVAAGSIGIAGGRTGLYALPGPGGWPLIGRTSFQLFDAAADEPFILQPGSLIRFVDAGRQ